MAYLCSLTSTCTYCNIYLNPHNNLEEVYENYDSQMTTEEDQPSNILMANGTPAIITVAPTTNVLHGNNYQNFTKHEVNGGQNGY